MKTIVLNGNDLTRHQVIDIAYNNALIRIDISKLAPSQNYIAGKVNRDEIVYGVTTGFGSKADVPIEKKDAEQLQKNLLLSHATGIGKPFPKEIVRAIMAIRLNTLLRGNSGVREETVKQLAFFLNNQIHPVIPEQGSVGASGDLCPLSHMALPLIGEGVVMDREGKEKCPTEEFINSAEANKIWSKPVVLTTSSDIPELFSVDGGKKHLTLSYKEGLALNNGTTVMTAVGVIALYEAERLLKINTLNAALIFEALCARGDAFRYEPIHNARNHNGQTNIAKWLTCLLEGSQNIDFQHNDIIGLLLKNNQIDEDIKNRLQEFSNPENKKQADKKIVYALRAKSGTEEQEKQYKLIADMIDFAIKKWKPQDAYSIRCLPQVFGASKTAIDHVAGILDNELNASVDNPLIFAENDDKSPDKVVSGGNFHGQPIALVMDYLKLAVAEIGNITERQINKMVDSNTNDWLPSFLVTGSGLVSGLMIPQYAAASIVSENKVLVHPASADSIPTCENTEDHVSMGTIAARQALEITENVKKITAIAILTAFYAASMRAEQFINAKIDLQPLERLAPATKQFYYAVKEANLEFNKPEFLSTDRFLSPEIHALMNKFDVFFEIADKRISAPE